MERQGLSIIVPTFNEEKGLPEFHKRLTSVTGNLDFNVEIIYINDGSSDDTLEVLEKLCSAQPNISVVDLSRNYGKEIAISAGLDHSTSDAVVLMDADLQHPPEFIPKLIAPWRDEGFDVVYATRMSRDDEKAVKRLAVRCFYWLIQTFGRVKLPPNAGDFRLLSRAAVKAVSQYREQHRFMKGLFAWIGFRQKSVPFKPESRYAGTTKWNYLHLASLAVEAITSFTVAPLRLASAAGGIIAILAMVYACIIVYRTIAYGDPVAGYPSLITVVLFMGGVQLMSLGIIGEYLGRVFDETKRRPLYHVRSLMRNPALDTEVKNSSDPALLEVKDASKES